MTDIASARARGSMPPPASYPPITIPEPADPKSTCINRDWFPNLNIDVQRDYAEHYNIPNATDLSSAEIVSILCTKNMWIPALEEHEWDVSEHGVNPFRRVPADLIEKYAEEERLRRETRYGKAPLERHPSPEDVYDFEDGGQPDKADKGKGREAPENDEIGEGEEWHPYSRPPLEFRYPPVPRVVGKDKTGAPILEPLDPDWLYCMIDELERNHQLLKAAIEEAHMGTREAEADVYELTFQIEEEKKFQQHIFEFVSSISGRKVAEQIEDDVAYAMEHGELPDRGDEWNGYGSDGDESDDGDEDDGEDGDNEDEEEQQDTQPAAPQTDSQPSKGSGNFPGSPRRESPHESRRFEFQRVELNGTQPPHQNTLKRAREEDDDEDRNDYGDLHKAENIAHGPERRPHKRLRLDEDPIDRSSSNSDGDDSPMEEAVGIPWHAYDDDGSDSSYSPSTSEESDDDSEDGDSESGYLSSSHLSDYSEDEGGEPKSNNFPQESQPATSFLNSGAGTSYAHLSAKHRPEGKPEQAPQPRAKRLKRDNQRLIVDPETGEVRAQDYTKTAEYKARREEEEEAIARFDVIAPQYIPCDMEADLAEITRRESTLYEFDRWEWRDFSELLG